MNKRNHFSDDDCPTIQQMPQCYNYSGNAFFLILHDASIRRYFKGKSRTKEITQKEVCKHKALKTKAKSSIGIKVCTKSRHSNAWETAKRNTKDSQLQYKRRLLLMPKVAFKLSKKHILPYWDSLDTPFRYHSKLTITAVSCSIILFSTFRSTFFSCHNVAFGVETITP